MKKVVVGMSGGVDSAVCAILLKSAGYEVIGVTLRTWQSDDGLDNRCCEIDDARSAAEKIGIPFYPFNCTEAFRKKVVEPFISEYAHGFTPNPCIGCNRSVKWEYLLYYARVLGADYVATGHYASVVKTESGRYTVKKALHSEKDQTYMLCALTQEQLSATLMPLGDLSKSEVRRIAAEAGLEVASKPDSQEICFITDGNYADFIEKNAGTSLAGEGAFVDESGNFLGLHKGIIHYTVGQRKGLGLALGRPVYVKEINTRRNEVVIGDEESLYSRKLLCRKLNFMSIDVPQVGEPVPCTAKVRYRHSGERAVITLLDHDLLSVEFEAGVRAACPGQAAVFYDEEGCVIGGGVIAEVLPDHENSL